MRKIEKSRDRREFLNGGIWCSVRMGKSLVMKIEFIKVSEFSPKFYKVWCGHIVLLSVEVIINIMLIKVKYGKYNKGIKY